MREGGRWRTKGRGEKRDGKRVTERERERRKNGGVGWAKRGEEKPERRYRTLLKGGRTERGGRGVAESMREIQMKSGKKRGRAGSGGER